MNSNLEVSLVFLSLFGDLVPVHIMFITQLIKHFFFAMEFRCSGAEHRILLHFQPYNPDMNPDCASEQSTYFRERL